MISSAKMSGNAIALPTHSHDATKAIQSTNIMNHDKNTTSTDCTSTHVSEGQKKRVGRKTYRHRRSKVVKDTITKEVPFDAKDTPPESKALKSITKPSESMKKVV